MADDDGKFIVRYVGRSDNHAEGVRGRLHQHDNDKSKLKSTHFKFDYFSPVKESYERECRIFHDFEPPDNDAHPPRPAGKKYRCPVSDACFSGDQDEDDG